MTIRLGTTLAAQGIRLIDAPVSGGVKKAAAGTLMVMAGGNADDIASANALINCFGTTQHVGPLGAGHAMKALNNYVSAAGLFGQYAGACHGRVFRHNRRKIYLGNQRVNGAETTPPKSK